MRKPKALVIPFRYREGYPAEIVEQHLSVAMGLLAQMGMDCDQTEQVMYVPDADFVNEKYNPNHYDLVILIVPTWIEPTLAARTAKAFMHLPVVLWGFGTFMKDGKRVFMGSLAGSGVVKGALREMGIPHEYIYQLPRTQEERNRVKARIWRTALVGRAISLLDQSIILSVGYFFGGMFTGDIDIARMRSKFGPELKEIDTYTLINRMGALDTKSGEFLEGIARINERLAFPIGEKIEGIARMYVALKQFVVENYAQALTVKCNFELSQEYGLTACIPLSILGNEVTASCEADIPLILTQLVMHYLSDGKITTYADVHELADGKALVAACGFAPSGVCIGDQVICDLQDENPQGLGATFGDYITNKNYLKEGLVTLARFLKDADGGFTLHLTTGQAVGDVGNVSELDTPQYPFTEIQLACDLDRFAQHMGSHHYAIVYGDIREEMELFCQLRGIRIISD